MIKSATFQLNRPSIIALLAMNLLNVCIMWRFREVPSSEHFTFLASDFPDAMPIPVLHSGGVIFNTSDHIPLMGRKSDIAWLSVSTNGVGYANLGSYSRFLGTSMFHELHCLRVLNAAFGLDPSAEEGHVRHCLGYLRSAATCAADTTVELGDFVSRSSGFWAPEARYTCANTDTIWDWMAGNPAHSYFPSYSPSVPQ